MTKQNMTSPMHIKRKLIIHPEELTSAFVDRLVSLGTDTLGIHPTGGEGAKDSLSRLIDLFENAEFRETLDYAASSGLKIEYELHAGGYLMPRELFDIHPEYFRMNEDGERVADFNFCVSNDETLELVADRAALLTERLYRSEPRYHLWLDDKKDAQCLCEKCRKLTPSDKQLIVMNKAVKKIRKVQPTAALSYLAYFECINPPSMIQPEDGIFLEYAPFEKYTAKGEGADALIENERKMLGKLIDCFGKEESEILEYWYDNSLLSDWKYPPRKFTPNGAKIRSEIAEYEALSPYCISSFACFLGKDYEALYGEADLSDFAKQLNL